MSSNSANYQVNLAFTADTGQARKQIAELQSQLKELMNQSPSIASDGYTKEIGKASAAVASLRTQLEGAVNVNTGKLDLTKFNQSLKKGEYSLEQYRDALINLGPSGREAFANLAKSITTAEIPIKRANSLLDKFAQTLENTIRWQVSSSLLNGFISSVQTAYSYAEDLNASLNSIRIVTGDSTDDMAKFAEQANRAAKELSATTLAYTDASLIFFQQGKVYFS